MSSVDGRIILKWILRKWDVKRRWEDNIKMDLEEVGFESMDWIGVA